jgi:hypothetical protein
LRTVFRRSAALNSQLSTLNWFDLFPAFTVPHTRKRLALGNRIQSQQRNCSRISREFLAPLHTCTDKELPPEVAGGKQTLKVYFARLPDSPQGAAVSPPPAVTAISIAAP